MKALSDPNRVLIAKLLGRRELCVCELTALFNLAQSTVSKHLRILEEAALVDFRKQGPWVIYRLADGVESEYAAVMLTHLNHWLEGERQLQDMLMRLPRISRDMVGPADDK